ncbi:MAG: redoxin domain-containing protein [Lachnospiraceae bacterium]
MKKIVSMMSIALLAICIAACGKNEDTETVDTVMTTEEVAEETTEDETTDKEAGETDAATEETEDEDVADKVTEETDDEETADATEEVTDEPIEEVADEAEDAVTEEVPAEEHSADNINQLNFSTTDINGASISFADIKGSSLIMVNFWEPWCGPCVGEMPELEKLYQNYKEQGLLILGVFYSTDYMDDARYVMDYAQITYPVVIGNNDFLPYVTEYVPTTVFFDSEGNLLNSEPVIGSRSYDDWEQEILKYLNN